MGGAEPSLESDLEGHTDWVNGLVLAGGDTLVSASSDRTLRVWAAHGAGQQSRACWPGHADYVTALAGATDAPVVVSAGLRGELIVWDLEVLRPEAGDGGGGGGDARPRAPGAWVKGVAGSIYSLAVDPAGHLIAAGTSDGTVWLLDARSGRCEARLQGHVGNVRALLLVPGAASLLSGSSDHTTRLWDLRQQRASQTFAVHTDSVWALAPADPGCGSVFSGGRDGCVYRTHLASRRSELVAVESAAVQALAVGGGGTSVWAATAGSTVHRWSAPPRGEDGAGGGADGASSSFVAGSLPAARSRKSFEGSGTRPRPLQARPAAAIPGVPPLRHVAVLTDRRHVLTQDAEGQVLLWDVTVGAAVRDLGRVPLKEAERALFDPAHNVPAWFQPDTRLGERRRPAPVRPPALGARRRHCWDPLAVAVVSRVYRCCGPSLLRSAPHPACPAPRLAAAGCLAGYMQAGGAFSAEAYQRDLGDAEAPPDAKINLGEHMLKAMFCRWAERQGAPPPPPAGDPAGAAASAGPAARAADGGDSAMEDASPPPAASAHVELAPIPAPAFRLRAQVGPVVLVSGGGGRPPLRRAVDAFDGSEREGEEVPAWVADCVLRSRYPSHRDVAADLKMFFNLQPAQGSALPSLLQGRLSAPRVLGVDKVADYVLRKMEENGVTLREEPLFWAQGKHERWEEEHGGAAAPAAVGGGGGIRQLRALPNAAAHQDRPLLITCNGAVSCRACAPGVVASTWGLRGVLTPPFFLYTWVQAVPWDFTLAAVRQWMWKRPEDLKLEYGVRQPGVELRPPVIRPPT